MEYAIFPFSNYELDSDNRARTRTIAVIGASYGGVRAAQILAKSLSEEPTYAPYRVVLVDRNSHANHLYVLPRLGVVPGHERKAFIPYTNVFGLGEAGPSTSHVFLHAQVTSVSPRALTLSRAFPEHGVSEEDMTLHFDYLVYALGSHLPAPIDLWGPVPGTKHQSKRDGTHECAVKWLVRLQKRVQRAHNVLVVGGGALGIQFASDIASHHPDKRVTLLHSRRRLLTRFDHKLHSEVLSTLESLGVDIMLGERLDLASAARQKRKRVVRTESGRAIRADLVLLCTGQKPNTSMLASVLPDAIGDGGLIRVARSMQIAVPDDDEPLEEDEDAEEDAPVRVPHAHMFAIGDAADAFGAIKAGHCAYYQAEVAARNILRLIRAEEEEAEEVVLEAYVPGPPAIKVSLGLEKQAYQIGGAVGTKQGHGVSEDLDAGLMWGYFGAVYDAES